MPRTCSDCPPKSLKTLEQLISGANSFEDYHGGTSASVPFTWESQPGTPKAWFREGATAKLPPLTPPPSYYSTATKRTTGKNSRPNLTNTIFPKRNARKPYLPQLSPASSTSSSSSSNLYASSPFSQSSSVPSSPMTTASNSHRQCRMLGQILSFNSGVDEKEHENESPVSTLCFSGTGVKRGSGGCYSSIIKVVLRDYK